MSLPWVRMDVGLPWHPKILALVNYPNGRESAFVYVCSLAYSGDHGLDGFIPEVALEFIHGRKVDAKRLVEVGLWNESESGGWDINDWADYQPSTIEMKERTEKARRAANARWHKAAQPGTTDAHATSNADA